MKASNYPNDQSILALIMILSGFGIVMMYSASTMVAMNLFNDYLHFFFQQIYLFFLIEKIRALIENL